MKPFEGPQRILKIKFKFIFYLRTGSGHEGLTGSRSILVSEFLMVLIIP